MKLSRKKCIPCEDKSIKPLAQAKAKELLKQVSGWTLEKDTKGLCISKTWLFKDFVQAMKFVTVVGKLAEREGHHPDIMISYNKVILLLWTHSIKGLSENDFILAAKINMLTK